MHFDPQRALNGFHNTVLDESARVESTGFVSDYRRWFDREKTGDYDIADHGIDWNSWMARPYHAPEFLHPTNWTVNESLQFLKERDPSRPFFLKTSFDRPHSPFDALPYYFELYGKKDLPAPFIGDWAVMNDVPKDAANPNAWRGRRSDEEIRRARAAYYGQINHIDHQIGRLLSFLSRSGLLANTLIIFTSDHGEMLGDHNLWRKTYAYEGSAHIPLIVRLPESLRNLDSLGISERVGEPVCLQDIMPTILEAVQSDIPDTIDGLSLLPLIRNQPALWREFVHGEHSTCYSEVQEMQYVTDGVWKMIWFPRLGTEQLFNLANDPGECHDLSDDSQYMEELLKWRNRLISVLEPRQAGLTDGDQLVCQAGRPWHVSPKYKERIEKWKANFECQNN